ncbi:hypothetical protein ABD07_05030 [Nitrosomonas oligotropha]|nr:hypothetical protein [Nitrosomonas oligotropha]
MGLCLVIECGVGIVNQVIAKSQSIAKLTRGMIVGWGDDRNSNDLRDGMMLKVANSLRHKVLCDDSGSEPRLLDE